MMMHFKGILPLLPMIPALFVFGLGMVLLYFAKKESSKLLKIGGCVMVIGTSLIVLFLLFTVVKHSFSHCGAERAMMNPMGGSCGCPMMKGMMDTPATMPMMPPAVPSAPMAGQHQMMKHK